MCKGKTAVVVAEITVLGTQVFAKVLKRERESYLLLFRICDVWENSSHLVTMRPQELGGIANAKDRIAKR